MPHVELPRPLEEYFAFAELERQGKTRRFTITMPYLANQQLGRLQWWWRVSDAEETLLGDAGMAARRAHEIERFRRHIERWLANTSQRLHGDDTIPRIAPAAGTESHQAEPDAPAAIPRRANSVANG